MRKAKILKIGIQAIVDMLKGDMIKIVAKATKDPIPEDAKVARMVYNNKEGIIYIELHSESFPPVGDEVDIPFLETTFQPV